MKNTTEVVTAITLFAFAAGLITFMITVGTLLAPIAIFVIGVAMVVLVIRELDKEEKRTKKKRKR